MPSKNQIVGGSFQDADGTLLNHGQLVLELSQDVQIPSTGLLGAGLTLKLPLDSQGCVMGTNTFLMTTVQVATNVLTIGSAVTLTSILAVGDVVVFPASMTASFLSSTSVTVLTVGSTSFTAALVHANYGPTAETAKSATIGAAVSVWPNDVLNPTTSYYVAYAYSSLGQQAFGPFYGQILSTPSPYNLGSWVPSGAAASTIVAVPTLQTNGVNNGLQGLLNLVAGAGITITNAGGAVTIRLT